MKISQLYSRQLIGARLTFTVTIEQLNNKWTLQKQLAFLFLLAEYWSKAVQLLNIEFSSPNFLT